MVANFRNRVSAQIVGKCGVNFVNLLFGCTLAVNTKLFNTKRIHCAAIVYYLRSFELFGYCWAKLKWMENAVWSTTINCQGVASDRSNATRCHHIFISKKKNWSNRICGLVSSRWAIFIMRKMITKPHCKCLKVFTVMWRLEYAIFIIIYVC